MKKFIPFLSLSLLLLVSLTGCKEKEVKAPSRPFISIPSLVKQQVAGVDSSLFVIRKVVIQDTLSDTSFIKREDFSKEAADFLSLPDLGDKKIGKDYRQDSAIYDETLNRVILTYRANDPDALIRKEQVLITPSLLEGDKITSILVSTFKSDRNGSVQKEMLWRMDKSFQVVTTTQSPGEPEKTITVKLIWNEDIEQ